MTGDGAARRLRVVAFGGGHGLYASLQALRQLDADLTAVVTVADDGGSSGRLRDERGALPPGDLRQALAALAADDPDSQRTAELFQYRFAGSDPLGGHATGNLLLTGLMELLGDPVAALDHAARMVRAEGRVLPMSRVPLSIEATVAAGAATATIQGQRRVAVTSGRVLSLSLVPGEPPACVESVAAVEAADWLVFGPGSWFTSVIPHLLVPELAAAIVASPASRLVALNLATERETADLSLGEHLDALRRYCPRLRVDTVLADVKAVGDPEPVRRAAESLGAQLVLAPVAVCDGSPRHDPRALAAALQPILRSD